LGWLAQGVGWLHMHSILVLENFGLSE